MIASQRLSAACLGGIFGLALVLFLPAHLAAVGTAPGDIAAFIAELVGEVEIYQAQRSPDSRVLGRDWRPAIKDQAVMLQDRIRTGQGKVVLQFTDRDEENDRGPSIFTINENTEVAIANFEVDFGQPRRVRGLLNLIRGAIQNFITGWGQHSQFSVRCGLTIASFRSGDATIEYIPEGERLTVTVHDGKVVVAGPRGSRIVEAGQTVRFIRGVPEGAPPA